VKPYWRANLPVSRIMWLGCLQRGALVSPSKGVVCRSKVYIEIRLSISPFIHASFRRE
jgi:hypothetical protein